MFTVEGNGDSDKKFKERLSPKGFDEFISLFEEHCRRLFNPEEREKLAIEKNIVTENRKNTRIAYLYRDACNYKQPNEEIVEGFFTKEQIDTIIGCLDGENFIPSQVGFAEVRFGEITKDDTCWFELSRYGFTETDEKPTIDMTPDEIVCQFLSAKGNWKDTVRI